MAKICGDVFTATYNARDLILYALSVGFGNCQISYQRDLKYVYEANADEFAAVPTFALSLFFWATRSNEPKGIPEFPPPIMRAMGILPQQFLWNKDIVLELFPVLHTWQSIVWHKKLVAPRQGTAQALLQSTCVSVQPKSIGTFVTTQTHVSQCNDDKSRTARVCTIQSTMLILGLPSESVIPYNGTSKAIISDFIDFSNFDNNNTQCLLKTEHVISTNMALFYRLASGDSNAIHVNANAMSESKTPLLHGLSTFGIVARVLLTSDEARSMQLLSLQAKFVKPIFIGDRITLSFWEEDSIAGIRSLLFRVYSGDANDVLVVDQGRADLVPNSDNTSQSRL
jgi:acyl dehydratase